MESVRSCNVLIFFIGFVLLINNAVGEPVNDYFLISDGKSVFEVDENLTSRVDSTYPYDAIETYSYDFGGIYYVAKDDNNQIIYHPRDEISVFFSQPRLWNPISIAVDYLNNKLYAVDEIAAKINVFDTRKIDADGSKYYNIILADLKKPNHLVLDPFKTVMFFSQDSSAIYRANLDGTNLTKVIEKPGITAVTVDITDTEHMLYWAGGENELEFSDYSGKKRMGILTMRTGISSLSVGFSRLAWTSPATWTRGSTVFIYADIAGSGHVTFKNRTVKNAISIQRHNKLNDTFSLDKTACDNDNGGCQQLCFLNNEMKSTSCACRIGYQLNEDLRTCRFILEFLLYVQGGLIRGKILDDSKESFTEAILPIKLTNHDRHPNLRIAGFDYDFPSGKFLYTDHHRIYHENVIVSSPPEIRNFDDFPVLKSIAVDWITGNVYTINDHDILVYNHRQNNTFFKYTFMSLRYRAHSLVVHPKRGYLFFIAAGDRNGDSRIYRINTDLDINSLKVIAEEQLNGLNATKFGVAIDYDADKLYQLCGSVIRYSDLNGNNVKSIDVSIIHDPRSIAVHEKWLYVANLTSIWKFDKNNGNYSVRIAPKYDNNLQEPISGIKIYSERIQQAYSYREYVNPCATNNGGCEQFCFAIPIIKSNSINEEYQLKKVCDCGRDQFLEIDGTSCGEHF